MGGFESGFRPATQSARKRYRLESVELPEETAHSIRQDFSPVDRRPKWRVLASCLTSTLLHLLLLILLGVLTSTSFEESSPPVLIATIGEQQAVDLEPFELEPWTEEVESEVRSTHLDFEPGEILSVELMSPNGTGPVELVTGNGAAVAGADRMTLWDEISALGGGDGMGLGQGGRGANFYGVPAEGNKFVFVVDGSISMRQEWEACRQELVAAVERLEPFQRFYVILFNYRCHAMFSDENPEPRPVYATAENVARLEAWLGRYQLRSGSLPQRAMALALTLEPDAIYFLTDGKLQDNTQGYLRDRRQEEPRDEDLRPEAAVHTIGFEDQPGLGTLQEIAEENGGRFRIVARSPDGRKPGKPPDDGE